MCVQKNHKICRTDRARRRSKYWARDAERRTNLFLSVLCFSFRFCAVPLCAHPSALSVSFTAKPLRAKLVNSSVTIPTGRILRRRLCHRNGQLLTESDHLFALELLIVECHFRLNFTDDKNKDIFIRIKNAN